jgi:ATP-dependent Lon protease
MEPVTKNLPVIAMRGLNVFPRMNTSFDLERPISVHALERAMENGEEIFLVTQREIGVEQPEEKDLYEIGTVARVTQILRVSDRVLRVMMEGACRARLKRLWSRFCRRRSSSSMSRPPRAIASGRKRCCARPTPA